MREVERRAGVEGRSLPREVALQEQGVFRGNRVTGEQGTGGWQRSGYWEGKKENLRMRREKW